MLPGPTRSIQSTAPTFSDSPTLVSPLRRPTFFVEGGHHERVGPGKGGAAIYAAGGLRQGTPFPAPRRPNAALAGCGRARGRIWGQERASATPLVRSVGEGVLPWRFEGVSSPLFWGWSVGMAHAAEWHRSRARTMPMVHIHSPTSRAALWWGGRWGGNHHVVYGGSGGTCRAPRRGEEGEGEPPLPQKPPPAAFSASFIFIYSHYSIVCVWGAAGAP